MVLYGFPHKLLIKLASFFLKAKSLSLKSFRKFLYVPIKFHFVTEYFRIIKELCDASLRDKVTRSL